jgi:hypothetical protein
MLQIITARRIGMNLDYERILKKINNDIKLSLPKRFFGIKNRIKCTWFVLFELNFLVFFFFDTLTQGRC